MKQFAQLLLIFFCGLFIYGIWLGNSPLDRTEPFRALVAHQMVHGSSWLIPHLYGELYQRKPPLIYWIEGGVELIAGRGNEFIWRLPSVVGAAFLASFLAWWAARWFGSTARLPTGFACLSLIALWDQNRSADIDALNTVAAVVSSVCVLELICGRRQEALNSPSRKVGGRSADSAFSQSTPGLSAGAIKDSILWTLALGLSVGAMLLLKGPGGLPQLFGAIIGPAVFLKSWRIIRRPSILIGILIGSAIFAAYVVFAKLAMQHANITADRTGWAEIIEKVFLHGWAQRLKAFLIPVELLAFALPASAALPFIFISLRRLSIDNPLRRRAMAILGTLAAGLVIWLIDGNDNPRYEYVMLPLIAPLVGFAWMMRSRFENGFSQTLMGVCVLLYSGGGVIGLKLPGMAEHVWITVGAVVSVVVFAGVMIVGALKPVKQPAEASSPVLSVGAAVLLILFALPMAARKNIERRRKSAMNPAAVLRKTIGNVTRVSAAGVVRDLPELFYYARVDVDSYGEFGLPDLVSHARGHWVVLSENESYPAYSTIVKHVPGAFPSGVTWLPMPDARDKICVGWYDPPAGSDVHIEKRMKKESASDD